MGLGPGASLISARALPQSPHFLLRPLADGVYVAFATETGAATCNAGIVDLGDATLVFDTFLTPQAGAALRAAAEALTGRPVDYVVNSHYHNDHIRGTQEFRGAAVIASEQTRDLIATKGAEETRWDSEVLPQRRALWEEQLRAATDPQEQRELALWVAYGRAILESLPGLRLVLPQLTFKHRLTIHGPARRVELIALSGHTPDDVVMVLPEDGIAFLADLLFVRMHPYLADGDPDLWLASLEDIERCGATTLVPGHGPLGTAADIAQLRRYIAAVQETARSLIDSGRGPEGVLPIPRAFRRWGFSRFYAANVRFVWERTRAT